MSEIEVPAQVVDATQALNRSAGVANTKVLRGRSLSCRATLLSWACEYTDRSVPFGKYCRSRPLVFLDMLLNDWGIHHLHISSVVEADGFVKRDDHLLLVSFKPDAAYLIDVMVHRDMTDHKWVRHHLLEVLASEWPHEGVIYEMKTPAAPNQLTETQRANLRGNHYNTAFSFGGRTFVPRGLMMANGTTMEAWLYARALLNRVGEVEKTLTETPRGCAAVFERYNSTLPDEPEFAFGIGNDGPAILEKKTGTWIALMG